MSKKFSTIQEELLSLLNNSLHGEVTVSRPVFDDHTGCYLDVLCHCDALNGLIVLKDGVNGDNNPCVFPVSQMSATSLVSLLEDTVRAERDSLMEDYSDFVGKVEMCDWADDAVRLLHLEKRVKDLDVRKTACRHIYDRLSLLVQWSNWEKDRVPEIRFKDGKGELRQFRDLPYILHLDTFAGLYAEDVSVIEAVTVEEVRNDRFEVGFSLSGEWGTLTHASVTKEDIILFRDHDWMPVESVLSLEELVNSLVRVDGFSLDEGIDLEPGENENNGLAVVNEVLKCGMRTSSVRYDTASDTLFLTLAGEEDEPREVHIHQFVDLGYYRLHLESDLHGPQEAAGMYDGNEELHEDISDCPFYLPSPDEWPWLARLFEALNKAGYNPTHIRVNIIP